MEKRQIKRIINAKTASSDQLFTIHIDNEKITSLAPCEHIHLAEDDKHCFDARGSLVLPGLIDIHTHIDKSFNHSADSDGTLKGAIETMAHIRQTRHLDTTLVKAEKAITLAIKHGVALLCSHIDLAKPDDLDTLRGFIDLKRKYADRIELKFTALGSTCTQEETDLMHAACELGIDMIGGAPALSDNPSQSLENILALGQEWQKDLDLHIDEKEDTHLITLEILADLCLHTAFSHKVLASHCCTLAFLSEANLQRVLRKVRQANIHIISLPMCNSVLMGRHLHPVPRGIPPIKTLQRAGINVCIGSDNVRDPFNPFGNYDPLTALTFSCIAAHISRTSEIREAMDFITSNPAKALGKTHYGIAPEAEANFCITDARSQLDCVVDVPERVATIYRGKLIYQKTIEEHWAE